MDGHGILVVILVAILLLSPAIAASQTSDYVFYRNFADHAEGTSCTHTPPLASFTAFLNRDLGRVLIENAPRWNPTGGANIPGDGTFGVEFGNFSNPTVQIGDSVFVQFTCNATQQQGTVSDLVTGIPWFYFPVHLSLSAVNPPVRPENVALMIDTVTNFRTVSWILVPGVTYTVYRRVYQDTLPNGRSRMLYARIAQNLTSDSYTDSAVTPGQNYGYIVFAVLPSGLMSAHSDEANETTGRIVGLEVAPRATTTTLSWRPFASAGVKGYNIYRRVESGTYGYPIAYTGLDTTFVDSRLGLGTTYHYKVKARVDELTEVASSDEVTVTTLSSQSGFYPYANLKVAVIVYQNTTRGGISASEVQKIRTMLDIGKLFYWRNSGMKLNLQFTYLLITELRDFGDPGNTNVAQTVADLDSLGVMNTQYDIVFRVTPATSGYWSYGVITLGLPGPARETGFSQSEWPVGTGVRYPGHLPGINYGLTWTFVHECQHAIDDLYRVNAHPEMYHGDVPWEFPVACGEHFDFQAKIFRTFTEYQDLFPTWGNIYEAVDADQDGLPDDEPVVAVDEARFGSSPSQLDTDADGLSDRAEAIDGTYSGSDPLATDTDGDSLADGQDFNPRYPVRRTVEEFSPTIDGTVEAGWPLVNDTVSYTQVGYAPRWYMSHDQDSLYVGLYLPNIGFPEISFDFQADGWWWGAGNTYMKIAITTGRFETFRSWDASPEVRDYSQQRGGPGGMWDDDPEYQAHFNRRVIYPDSVHLVVTLVSSIVQIEMAIPRRVYAGLLLNPGDSLAANINYTKVNDQPYEWATTFDQYSFVGFILGGTVDVQERPRSRNLPTEFRLDQNFPNPFNPETEILYNVPHVGFVTIAIYNTLGQRVRTLVDAVREPGVHRVRWDGRDNAGTLAPAGVYFCRMLAQSDVSLARKMVLLK